MAAIYLFRLFFTFFSVIIAGADIKNGEVPRLAFILAFPVFFIMKFLINGRIMITESIAGAAAGFLVFILAFIITNKKLGLADVWYSALTGMALGTWQWYLSTLFACVTGVFIILIISKNISKKQIPFIPCMAAGNILIFLTGG